MSFKLYAELVSAGFGKGLLSFGFHRLAAFTRPASMRRSFWSGICRGIARLRRIVGMTGWALESGVLRYASFGVLLLLFGRLELEDEELKGDSRRLLG